MATRRNLLTDQSGATAVEFSLVAGMLIMTIVFIMSVGLMLYYNQTLDLATYRASRQVMLGTVQRASTSKDDFKTNFICTNLPSFFDCSKVIVNLQTVTERSSPSGYYAFVNASQTALIVPNSSTGTQFSPGVQQNYEYLEVVYPLTFLPSPFASLLSGGATYNGSPAVLLVSTAAFRNEQYNN